MGKLTAFLFSRLSSWDDHSRMGFLIATIVLIIGLITALFGPSQLEWPATISVMGAIIAMQGIVMWANRHMISDYTRAQRFYMDGDFAAARDLLEAMYDTDKINTSSLTLLGNTYRQLGDLATSEKTLLEALQGNPDHHFPLYGLGRTLLAQGRFTEAAETIEMALDNNAPAIVYFDAGEARYRHGDHETARHYLQIAVEHVKHEPHRALMVAYLLDQIDKGESPSDELITSGLPYWQAQAELFQATPYGQALEQDIAAIRQNMD